MTLCVPSHADNWFDKTGKKYEDVKIKCADPQVGKWSEWSNWSSDCSCRFRGTYEKELVTLLIAKETALGSTVQKKNELFRLLGEIEVELPDVDEFRKSPELSMVVAFFI